MQSNYLKPVLVFKHTKFEKKKKSLFYHPHECFYLHIMEENIYKGFQLGVSELLELVC